MLTDRIDSSKRIRDAAPELLAAAKQLAADFDIQVHGGRAHDHLQHWQALLAAIAKAEGR